MLLGGSDAENIGYVSYLHLTLMNVKDARRSYVAYPGESVMGWREGRRNMIISKGEIRRYKKK